MAATCGGGGAILEDGGGGIANSSFRDGCVCSTVGAPVVVVAADMAMGGR